MLVTRQHFPRRRLEGASNPITDPTPGVSGRQWGQFSVQPWLGGCKGTGRCLHAGVLGPAPQSLVPHPALEGDRLELGLCAPDSGNGHVGRGQRQWKGLKEEAAGEPQGSAPRRGGRGDAGRGLG